MKYCKYCAEEIQTEAIKCKHCGEFQDKKSILDKSKDLINESVSFLREKNEERLEKKYAHLHQPTEENPFVLGVYKIYKNHIEEPQKKFQINDIRAILFEEHSEKMNGVKTKEVINCEILIQGYGQFWEIDFSVKPLLAMARSKEVEKVIFIKEYLAKRTFSVRLKNYIDGYEENRCFPFAGTNYGVRKNGDIIDQNGNTVANILIKLQEGLVEYKNTKWGNYKINSFDPYTMTIYKSAKPKFKLFGLDFNNKIEIKMSINQDLNDYILSKIFDKKSISYIEE